MSSSLSSVMANIYMEHFEEMALGTTPLKLIIWLRYIVDTLILWPHQEAIQILSGHVNSVRPSIQFTMGGENKNKIACNVGVINK